MLEAEKLHERIQHFVAEFFSTVRVNLFRNSQFVDPVDIECFGHGDGFFVRDCNGLRVLRWPSVMVRMYLLCFSDVLRGSKISR